MEESPPVVASGACLDQREGARKGAEGVEGALASCRKVEVAA